MAEFRVRRAVPSDCAEIARMAAALWPESSAEEHARELLPLLEGRIPNPLPLVIFVAELATGALVGFAEVTQRSHADGCDFTHPVGYLEGWYVDAAHRRRGIGRALVRAAEDWARALGSREMASDTWLDNEPSQRAHAALGYEEVDRCVHYRKPLSSES